MFFVRNPFGEIVDNAAAHRDEHVGSAGGLQQRGVGRCIAYGRAAGRIRQHMRCHGPAGALQHAGSRCAGNVVCARIGNERCRATADLALQHVRQLLDCIRRVDYLFGRHDVRAAAFALKRCAEQCLRRLGNRV